MMCGLNSRVLLGMSGGVDSTASALLLRNLGYEVIGVTYRLTDDAAFDSNIKDAEKAAKKAGIEYIVADYRNQFKKCVIDDFVSEYADGRTPNPCVVCNKHIKYGEFLKTAESVGAYYIATGQYAGIREDNGRYYVVKPKDRKKDQTYFLYTLKEPLLKRILFPMCDIESKDVARKLVKDAGIEIFNKRDSQEICFIKGCSYNEYVKGNISREISQGNFTDKFGNILGKHEGVVNYTVGQRKGLGIALGKPVFVIEIDAENNRVVLGSNDDLFTREVKIKDYTFVNEEYDNDGIRLWVKIRYAAKAAPAVLHKSGEEIKIIFDDPVRAATKGQSAVFYDGDILAGGGIIC